MKASVLSKTCFAILNLNFWIAGLSAAPLGDNSTNPPADGADFVFDSITPSDRLEYHRCFGIFECARLLVPLDYLSDDPSSANASIAIIKLASSQEFPEYGPTWGGPVLLNPGGPGGSGVAFVLSAGATIQQVIGPQYSIIGFDPRGVNNSRPAFSCFDNTLDRKILGLKKLGNPLGSGSGEEIGENFVKGKIFGKLCTSGERGEQAKYVGIASVARDMLAINDASWDLATDGRRKGLQYWGFSYGSVLGITFAKMFPEKIERLVLDGILGMNDFFNLAVLNILLGTDTAWNSFYTYCSVAGPLRCAFHTGTQPEHIRQRVNALLTSLRNQPLAYFIPTGSGEGQPDLFTYSDLKEAIVRAIYSPLASFPLLAELFANIESALPTGWLPVDPLGQKPSITCPVFNDTMNESLLSTETWAAITCGDIRAGRITTLSDFKKLLATLRSQSEIGGDFAGTSILGCVGWEAQSAEKLPAFVEPDKNETYPGAAPILFIGNTADPVTPLANAYTMAKLFPKNAAAVVVQEGEGHCTVNVPSQCMMGLVRDYFKTGVARDGTRCSQQLIPFMESGSNSTTKRNVIEEGSIHNLRAVSEALNRQWKGDHGIRLGL